MNGITSTGYSGPDSVGAKELRKTGSIGLNLNELNECLEVLGKTVAQHESRINPILTPVPPNNNEKPDSDGSPTDLGRALVNFKYKVRAITEHLRSIDSRVEL